MDSQFQITRSVCVEVDDGPRRETVSDDLTAVASMLFTGVEQAEQTARGRGLRVLGVELHKREVYEDLPAKEVGLGRGEPPDVSVLDYLEVRRILGWPDHAVTRCGIVSTYLVPSRRNGRGLMKRAESPRRVLEPAWKPELGYYVTLTDGRDGRPGHRRQDCPIAELVDAAFRQDAIIEPAPAPQPKYQPWDDDDALGETLDDLIDRLDRDGV